MRDELCAPIALPDWVWKRADTRVALRERRLGRLFRLARRYAGASQTRITIATGISQGDVSKMISSDHQAMSIDVLERVAKGFQMPDQARLDLGVAPQEHSMTQSCDDRFGFAATIRNDWSGTQVSRPVPDYSVDWNVMLPRGRSLGGAAVAVQLHPATCTSETHVAITAHDTERLSQFVEVPRRGLLISAETTSRGQRFFALDAREGRRLLRHRPADQTTLSIPRAYELDDLTRGIMWALANADDGLLAEDQVLDEFRRELAAHKRLPSSAVGQQAAQDLAPVAQMWLGSNFCAGHILRNTADLNGVPLFWTREQRGEEASAWLLFRHKYEYLCRTSEHFGGSAEPLIRAFCVPESAVRESCTPERILLFLAVALMESLGIQVRICTEPDYSNVEGFVLLPRRQAIIANWLRSEGICHVDTTRQRSALRDFDDAAAHVGAHSVIHAPTPQGRLTVLSEFLCLDWAWLRRRCRELGEYGAAGLARPSSRLVSVVGLDAACRYVGGLHPST